MTVTVEEVLTDGIESGVTVQETEAGSPLQRNLTLAEKLPPTGPTFNWYVAVPPAVTVELVVVEVATKSIPDPARFTTWVVPVPDSTSWRLPV